MRDPTAFLGEEYGQLVTSATDWKLRVLGGPSTPWCVVDGKKVLMFCSNNYLGLSEPPEAQGGRDQGGPDARRRLGVGAAHRG